MRHRSHFMAAFMLASVAGTAAAAPSQVINRQTAALLDQCTAVMPQAHPWRARQLRNAMFRLRVSMAYHVAEGRLSPSELRAAATAERDSYELLVATCKPLLI